MRSISSCVFVRAQLILLLLPVPCAERRRRKTLARHVNSHVIMKTPSTRRGLMKTPSTQLEVRKRSEKTLSQHEGVRVAEERGRDVVRFEERVAPLPREILGRLDGFEGLVRQD